MTAKKNEALVFSGSLEAVATAGDFQVNPTLATGDFKTSKDGGALANLATLPTVTPAGGSLVQFSLSAAEMNGDHIVVVCKDAAGDEWRDVNFSTLTSTRDIDDLAFPTTSGRGLGVTAGGTVGIDWANVENPTTAVNLSATNIDVDQVVASVSGNVGGSVASVTGLTPSRLDVDVSSRASPTNITAGTMTTTTNLTNAPTNGDLTATMKTSVTTAATAATPNLNAAYDAAKTAATQSSVDAVAAKTVNLPSDPADQSLIIEATDAILTAVNTRLATAGYTAPDNAGIAAIKLKTDLIPAAPAAVGDIPTASENVVEYLTHDLATVTGEADRSVLNALRILRNKWSVADGTLTVTKENDTDAAWTALVSTDAAADPITGSDPT